MNGINKADKLKQGEGVTTPYKQEGFAAVFAESLRISKAPSILSYPYWHLDLNAGSGFNEKSQCDGSPITFLKQAILAQRRTVAVFCDIEQQRLDQLKERISALKLPASIKAGIKCMDNVAFLDVAANYIASCERKPEYSVGTLLSDPNGPKGTLESVHAIARFASVFKRIDVVLNINSRVLHTILAGCKGKQKGFDKYLSIPEMTELINKRFWLIRNIPKRNAAMDTFLILVGRNHPAKSGEYEDFFPLNSVAGQHIATTLTRYTNKQKLLFDEAV